mmetsp:Transcript_93883/g.268830  ORF Transcript_93883/g.268830 Transcript_93883/m.268830 type:complete len:254 (-) Transcript_93883:88-849(-)
MGNNYGTSNTSAGLPLGWGGVGLAISKDGPLGPFVKQPSPVLVMGEEGEWDDGAIHEHTLERLPNGTYVLLYTGFSSTTRGDQGGLATSEDLLTWTKHPSNPILPSAPLANSWDGSHRRPRSLSKVGDFYYMLYEGAAEDRRDSYHDNSTSCYRDAIGLARSTDLLNWATDHDMKVAIPPSTNADEAFAAVWTGWPRAAPSATFMREYPDNKGSIAVLHAVGGDDFVDQGDHHYASVAKQEITALDLEEGWGA